MLIIVKNLQMLQKVQNQTIWGYNTHKNKITWVAAGFNDFYL